MKIHLTINHDHVARVLKARRQLATGESFRTNERNDR